MSQSEVFISFFSHLEEARDRLIKALVAFVCASLLAWNFIDPLLSFIVSPIGHIVFTSPADAFNARVTLAMTGGFVLALPVIFYQLWKFIAAGLTDHEKKYVKVFGPLSFGFFFVGVLFGYGVILPISLKFLMSFSSPWMVPMITVDKYISFVSTIIISSAVTFELPLILAFLAYIGIATPQFLRQKRRHAIVLIFIAAAILTPPDVVSQIVLAVSLLVLYELGILFSCWAQVKHKGQI